MGFGHGLWEKSRTGAKRTRPNKTKGAVSLGMVLGFGLWEKSRTRAKPTRPNKTKGAVLLGMALAQTACPI